MGWDYCYKPRGMSILEFFRKDYGDQAEVLDCAVVNMRTAYLAVKYRDGFVGAVVAILDYPKHDPDGMNFGYKLMSEDMGPCADHCPKHILDLLSPIDGQPYPPDISVQGASQLRQWAREWRDKCWANIKRKESLPKFHGGEVIKLKEPITFTNHKTHDTFVVAMKRRNRPQLTADGIWYNVPNWQTRELEIIASK